MPRTARLLPLALLLIAACNKPKEQAPPLPNAATATINAARAGAKEDSAAMQQSEDRMRAAAAEAADGASTK